MGKRDLLFILIFCFLFTFRTWAAADIGFGAVTLSSDTVKPNDTLVINTWLINYGPGAFSGSIGFNFAINGVQNINRDIFNNPIGDQTIDIAANDSIALLLRVVVQKQYMIPGSDIFVVWPILANGNNVQDSLAIDLNVTEGDPAGINGAGSLPQLKMVYNGQSIVITYPSQPEPAEVRIFDVEGRVIYTAHMENTCVIPFYNQVAGVYFVEVSFTGDIRKVFKVVKLDR